MAKTITQEERQLIKLIERLPLAETDKDSWLERIRGGEMSNDLAETIREAITALPAPEDDPREQAKRTQFLTEYAMLIKRWRLSSQAHNFGKK